MVDAGKIEVFTDIFKFIPKTKVATDLGKKVDRFNELMSHVGQFKLDEIAFIGNLFDISADDINALWMKEYHMQKENIAKVKKRPLK